MPLRLFISDKEPEEDWDEYLREVRENDKRVKEQQRKENQWQSI